MSELYSVLLADRGVIRVGGRDKVSFLQGLITNDMTLLERQKAIHAGLLSPQGKILFDFFVIKHNGDFLLESARDMTAPLAQRLSMYKLRTQVTIEDVSRDYSIAALWNGTPLTLPKAEEAIHFQDPRLEDLGLRLLMTLKSDWLPAELDAKPTTHDNYDTHRISHGVPEGGKDYAFGDTYPHEALFDQLCGVSFTKGCYIGQEIVSRMQHRASIRRRIVPVSATKPLPVTGTQVCAGSSQLGQLGTVIGTNALAKLRLDRVKDAMKAKTPLEADGVEITINLPRWATFALDAPAENSATGKTQT